MGLGCIQKDEKDQPNQIARQCESFKDKEAARLEREAAERADDLNDAARDAKDARLRAESGLGGIGLFPVPAAPIGIAMIVEEQARRQRHDRVLSDSSTVRAIAREGLFAEGSSPAQRNVNSYHIDEIEMDDLPDRGRTKNGPWVVKSSGILEGNEVEQGLEEAYILVGRQMGQRATRNTRRKISAW